MLRQLTKNFGKGTYYTTDINYAAQYGKTHKAQIGFKNPFITENAYEVEKLGHDAFTFSENRTIL